MTQLVNKATTAGNKAPSVAPILNHHYALAAYRIGLGDAHRRGGVERRRVRIDGAHMMINTVHSRRIRRANFVDDDLTTELAHV